jgi:hypothetical protein
MRRNLWIIDLLLLAAVILVGIVLKQRWSEMSLREEKLLKQVVSANPPPPLPELPKTQAVTAAAYMNAVQQMLFARDRNPNVILDPPPPPPPPPQMPPLPVSFGMVDIGDGPRAILAEKAGAPHKSYRPGDVIGAFKVVAMNNKEILFDWDGQPVRKTFAELAAAKATVPASGHMEPAPAVPTPAQAAEAARTTSLSGPKGPGADLGKDSKACVAGDSTPAGTIQDGLRKVVTKSPFGDVCRWEPVK